MQLNIDSLSIVILVASCLMLTHLMRKSGSWQLRLALVWMCMLSFWVYFEFFRMHTLFPTKPSYVAIYGDVSRTSWVHWHEMLHYYLGAKYYRELGYNGLYDTITLADSLSSKPCITLDKIKDLSNIPHLVTKADAIRRASEIYRPRFSDMRWQEFAWDVEYMKSIAKLPEWMDHALFDAGFNPPPTWVVIGGTVANLIPIASPWFNYSPTTEQIGLLPWFDNIMLLTGFFTMICVFGVNHFMAFFIAFGTSFIVNYEYNFGSLFRYTWLFGIIMSMAMLKKERYLPAGMFIGLASVDRFFPGFFAVGGALTLGWEYYRNPAQGFKPLRDFGIGFLSVSIGMILLSLAMFGMHAWVDFYRKISNHAAIIFTNHIGYFRVATFDDWVYHQNFWGDDGAERFIEWNRRLYERWAQVKWMHYPVLAALVGGAVACARKIPVYESMVLFGTLILVLFAVTAGYYFSFLALIPLVLYRQPATRSDMALFTGFFVMWTAMRYLPTVSGDDIIQNFYISSFLVVFLAFWIIVRLAEPYFANFTTTPEPSAPHMPRREQAKQDKDRPRNRRNKGKRHQQTTALNSIAFFSGLRHISRMIKARIYQPDKIGQILTVKE